MIERRRSIRSFALVCVAITSVFIMGMRIWTQYLIASTDWCAKALGAAKYANGRPAAAIDQCFELMTLQLEATSRGNLIDSGVIALCLLVLMVIVVAGGRFYFKASESGVETTIGRDEAARAVAGAAEDKAEEITGGDTPP